MSRRAEDCSPYLKSGNLLFPATGCQRARVEETVRAAANLISLVAPNDCGQSLRTNTRVPGHNYPGWLRAIRMNLALFFHGLYS